MKTERRHDLETNTLALKLTQWIESLKPHANKLLGLLALVVGLMAINSIWNSKSAAKAEAAWDEFAKAKSTTDPELMNMQKLALAEEYVGTQMQEWAQITWADRQVLLASRSYLLDRKAALDRLRGVIGIYDGLSKNASDPEIRDRCHFGLGRVYELQNKVEEAQRHYAMVQGALSPIANQRSQQLLSEAVKEDCHWLATAELPKRDLTGGQGASGERPSFEASLPGASSNGSTSEETSLEQMLKDFQIDDAEEDRYEVETPDTDEAQPAAENDADGA